MYMLMKYLLSYFSTLQQHLILFVSSVGYLLTKPNQFETIYTVLSGTLP